MRSRLVIKRTKCTYCLAKWYPRGRLPSNIWRVWIPKGKRNHSGWWKGDISSRNKMELNKLKFRLWNRNTLYIEIYQTVIYPSQGSSEILSYLRLDQTKHSIIYCGMWICIGSGRARWPIGLSHVWIAMTLWSDLFYEVRLFVFHIYHCIYRNPLIPCIQ